LQWTLFDKSEIDIDGGKCNDALVINDNTNLGGELWTTTEFQL